MPAGFLAGLAQGRQEQCGILVIQENGFAAVAAIQQMINRSFIFDPNWRGMRTI